MAASNTVNRFHERTASPSTRIWSTAMFFALICINPAHAGDVLLNTPSAAASIPVKSFHERLFTNTVKQQFDFSCGSAALATLLTYHYEFPVSERDIFLEMYKNGNKEKIKKEGFSLLDLKNYLESKGFRSDGFRLPLEKILKVGVPAIALINDQGYNHFVVIKGISADQVLIGDPARGTRALQREEFTAAWNGIVFLIRTKRNIAVKHFNDQEQWHAATTAPLDMAVDRNMLADTTLFFRSSNEF